MSKASSRRGLLRDAYVWLVYDQEVPHVALQFMLSNERHPSARVATDLRAVTSASVRVVRQESSWNSGPTMVAILDALMQAHGVLQKLMSKRLWFRMAVRVRTVPAGCG